MAFRRGLAVSALVTLALLSGCPAIDDPVVGTTYTVSYVGLGAESGAIPVDAREYEEGDLVLVKGNEGFLARGNFDFDGWTTAPGGSGVARAEGDTFVMGRESVTLYARWKERSGGGGTAFSVTYHANGATSGSVPVDSLTYASGATVTVKYNTGSLAKTGYVFSGWNTLESGAGVARGEGSTFSMGGANVDLHARWTAESGGGTTFTENMSLPQSVRDYYREAYGLSGSALKAKLQQIITSTHSAKSYDALWTMFKSSDVVTAPGPGNGKVWDMYSSTAADGSTAAYWFTFVTDQAGNFSGENQKYNREHTWPKSNFSEVMPAYSDGHHLTPTDGYVNGKRSNWAYGEVGTVTWTSQNGSKLGYPRAGLGYDGSSSDLVFEPLSIWKGDHARIHFYMALRYYGNSSFASGKWSLSGAKLKTWYDTMLRAWAAADPVSDKEKVRNDAVFAHQGNRNPFIDYPELINLLDLTN